MYLKEIYLENTGPISKCRVEELPFDSDGNPLPIVIVGPNGSGKSIFLSYIVDALTEFAKKVFRDITPSDGLNSPYFRIISQRAIRSGELFSLSLLRFKANDADLYYCEKSGVLDPRTYLPDLKPVFRPVWKWPTEGNHKDVSVNEETVETEMQSGAHAFFPTGRREDPDWLNLSSLRTDPNPFLPQFNRQLDKPLWIETCAQENISWILGVFFDSLIDLLPQFRRSQGRDFLVHEVSASEIQELKNNIALRHGRQNVESILQNIFQGEEAELIRNYRNAGPSRISIKMGDGRIIPTLQSLSAGQSQLFHLFATIIRYGERTDLNRSIHLSEITGLVVVDEIDANLHPTFQYDVLPKLIKKFPKVQFIVSSHSPLFLLGMEKEFGPDRLAIFELPDGDRIGSEQFSEFEKAFECYQNTEHSKEKRKQYEEEIKQLFAAMTKPVVLTEGKTDAQYIRKSLELLEEENLLNFLEIKPVGNDASKEFLPGGTSGLDAFRKTYVTHPSYVHHPILLLYDCDVKEVPKPDGKLSVKSIPPNDENTKVKGGIENLFPAEIFQNCFYDEKVIEKSDGGHRIETDLNKPKFCDWICEHGNAADFEGFKKVVKILKEFVETHQSSHDQQSASE